jgi:predicted RNA-binding protein with TRAM domain
MGVGRTGILRVQLRDAMGGTTPTVQLRAVENALAIEEVVERIQFLKEAR